MKINVSNISGSRKKIYEQICIHKNENYKEVEIALPIVRKFIIDRSLIIYGGMAIDFALKKFGDKIYDDNVIPDYDFLSPNYVSDTYDLTDILYKTEGITKTELSCKPAMHLGTMTVKLHNIPIADISNISPPVFKLLCDKWILKTPDGVNFVHPTYQYVDLHSALAYPFQNSPLESIFHRLEKDIERMNKLHDYYEIETSAKLPNLGKKIDDLASGGSIVPCGITAFSIYANMFGDNKDAVLYGDRIEYITDEYSNEYSPKVENLIHPHREDKDGNLAVNIYGDQFLLADEISKNGNLIKLPSVNVILCNLIGFYFVFKKEYYLMAYKKLCNIVRNTSDKRLQVYVRPEKLFGIKNISVIQKFKISKMAQNVGHDNIKPEYLIDLDKVPRGYSPNISNKYNLKRPDQKV